MFNITQNGQLVLFHISIDEQIDYLLSSLKDHHMPKGYLFIPDQLESAETYE